jgi:hypothetical protein
MALNKQPVWKIISNQFHFSLTIKMFQMLQEININDILFLAASADFDHSTDPVLHCALHTFFWKNKKVS